MEAEGLYDREHYRCSFISVSLVVSSLSQTSFCVCPYRRLLQMGVYNCQLYNNLGLCCFYAQQYDMTLSSFERALALVANDEELADVWYNIGHVAVVRIPASDRNALSAACARCQQNSG